VDAHYQAMLNRTAESAALAAGAALVQNGGDTGTLIVMLATSSEFASQANADAGQLFVTPLYQELLGRSPEPAALAFYAGEINSGTASRLQVVEQIQSSPEYRTNAVDALYQNVLGRAPDPSGLAGALAFLAQGSTQSQLEAMLLSSDEFFT